MAATVSEIAREVGVSVSLASRVLRGDKTIRVSPGRRQAVLETAQRLGGVRRGNSAGVPVSALARNIVLPANEMFQSDGVQVHTFGNPLYQSLREYLKSRGFRLSVSFFSPADEYEEFEGLIEAKQYCDGMVLGSGVFGPRLAELVVSRNFPHVSVDADAEKFGFNTVTAHAMGGLRQAVRHLTELGHRQIGYLGSGTATTRYGLWCAVMAQEALPVVESSQCLIPLETPPVKHDAWLSEVRASIHAWLDRGVGKTTAMICSNDELAMMLVEQMRKRGMEPSRQLSVIGYDNIEGRAEAGASVSEPFLTTIDNPREAVGRRCGEVLLNQLLYGQHQIVHEQIPTKLIIRRTTGPVQRI